MDPFRNSTPAPREGPVAVASPGDSTAKVSRARTLRTARLVRQRRREAERKAAGTALIVVQVVQLLTMGRVGHWTAVGSSAGLLLLLMVLAVLRMPRPSPMRPLGWEIGPSGVRWTVRLGAAVTLIVTLLQLTSGDPTIEDILFGVALGVGIVALPAAWWGIWAVLALVARRLRPGDSDDAEFEEPGEVHSR